MVVRAPSRTPLYRRVLDVWSRMRPPRTANLEKAHKKDANRMTKRAAEKEDEKALKFRQAFDAFQAKAAEKACKKAHKAAAKAAATSKSQRRPPVGACSNPRGSANCSRCEMPAVAGTRCYLAGTR